MNEKKINDEKSLISFQEILLNIDFDILSENGFEADCGPDDVVIGYYAHCLPSLAILISHIIRYVGVKPEDIYLLPKKYSTILSVFEKISFMGVNVTEPASIGKVGHYDESMSRTVNRFCLALEKRARQKEKVSFVGKVRVILMDDGGFLTEHWERMFRDSDLQVVSIQQTTSGVWRSPVRSTIPKINMAQSAAKRHFESKVIANGVVRKTANILSKTKSETIGIVGYGAIGQALAHKVLDYGRSEVLVYDTVNKSVEEKGVVFLQSSKDILRSAHILFGCTGRDWVDASYFRTGSKTRRLYSCSSRDVEFKRLLQNNTKHEYCSDYFGDVILDNEAIVSNGGFPVNFDRSHEWETFHEIALTRALMLLGLMQAMCLKLGGVYTGSIALPPLLQKKIVCDWFHLFEMELTDIGIVVDNFPPDAWWAKESLGRK